MVQIQMIRSKFSQNLNRCYQEYIEYFNEQQFTPITISLLFIFQSLSISCAILSKISNEEPFLSLSILGGHHILTALSSLSKGMQITIASLMVCFLVIPFSVPFHLIYESIRKEYIRTGEFKKKCDFSLFHSFMRGYLITFQYLFLPLLLFYFISLQTVAFTASICIFSIFLIVFVDYHIIQIIYKEGYRIIKLTFPYKLIDTALYIATIFIANNQNYNLCMIGVFIGNLSRILLSLFLHFYSRSIMKIHQFYLIFNQILLTGLMIAYYSSKSEFVLYNVLLLTVIIFFKRQQIIELIESCKKKEQRQQMLNEEQQYFQQSTKNNQLSSLQLQFQKQGHFAGIFRKLIMMGKKSTDNRQYLLIQVLKSKCYGIEISSRGTSAKIMDCQTVMKYESLLKEIVCLTLEISNRTISILKLMKMRDESIYIFNQEVQVLITYVQKIKNLVRELMKINQWSQQGQFIINLMFAHITHDEDFLEQVRSLRKTNRKQSDKHLKVHLFNQKTVMIFLNMLDQLGKIVKTSKNLPTILGYNPNQLQGIQIDNLLLSSMKTYHIQHVTNFIDSYDKLKALNPTNVLFYINNNNYELQKIDVGYNFVMSSFNIFQMCGIINKVEFEGDIIILNKIGNIQGFTKKIGNQLGLNHVAGPQMSKYNILSLMPALLKYGDKAVRIKTIIFKVKNMQSNVWKLEQNLKASIGRPQITNHIYQLFLQLLQDDIVDAYLAEVDVNYVSFFNNQVIFTVIQIKNYQKIINFCHVKSKIQASFKNTAVEQQTEMRNYHENDGIMSLNQEEHKKLDTNFTLDTSRHSMVKMRQIQTDQQQIHDQKSFQVMAMLKSQEESPSQKYQRQNSYVGRGNKMKIERNWQCADVLVLLILSFIVVIALDYEALNSKVDQLQKFNRKIISNNKALSIILKSLYHANLDDIDNFSNNNLLNTYSELINYNFNYTTFYNSTIIYNYYHLFNVHIPSLLKNLLSKNTTIAQHSTIQLNLNINAMITEADRIFKQILRSWGNNTDSVSLKYKLMIMFIILTAISVIIIAMFMVYYRRKQLVTYEAFFKFEKEELQQKITDIKARIKELQAQVMKWYLLKQFHNYIKEGDIFNLEFQSINAIYQPKVGFQISNEKQQSIKNGQLHKYIIYILVFALFQALLCLLYVTENSSFIYSLTNIPKQIDLCSKSMISPPFLLTSINRTVPSNIMQDYINATEKCISQKVTSLPHLLDFSSTAPCANCTILYPYLTTNYLSYFNSFEEMVGIHKAGFPNENNLTQMIQSASIFSRNLQEQLYLWQNISPSVLVTVLYLSSAFLILLFMFINIVRVNKEIGNVEIFLQFFSKEMIENNMRMVNLLVKNQ